MNLIINKKINMQMNYNKIGDNIEITIHNVKIDALVPFADLLNQRRPRQTQWFYDNIKDAFIFQSI